MKVHCCEMLREQVTYRCDQHPNPFDCADNLIVYRESSDDYGLIVHDGGESVVTIKFCPWCAADLESTRKIKRRLRLRTRVSDHDKAFSMPQEVLDTRYPVRSALISRQRDRLVSVANQILAGGIDLAEGARQVAKLQHSVSGDAFDADFMIFHLLELRLNQLSRAKDEGRRIPEELYTEFYKEAILDACRRLVARFGRPSSSGAS
jgi:hypothetical protein